MNVFDQQVEPVPRTMVSYDNGNSDDHGLAFKAWREQCTRMVSIPHQRCTNCPSCYVEGRA